MATTAPLIDPALSADDLYRPRVRVRERGFARVDSVDILRGLVMVIMMLDHTRDFVHSASFDPTDLTQTNGILFFTRWITHLCAPTFVFLAGLSVSFQARRGISRAALSRFLVMRGLWLIVLEFTVIRLGIWFSVYRDFLGTLQVIWVIGVSMIILAGLLWIPATVVGFIAVLTIALHHLLDDITIPAWTPGSNAVPSALDKLWMILHQPGLVPIGGPRSPVLFVLYPLIPWFAVMAAGYVFGTVYKMESKRRQRIMARLAVGLLATFVILRAMNVYGDPHEWEDQATPFWTALSFLNVTKYPPSLLYLCVTLGIMLLLLLWFERRQAARRFSRVEQVLVTYGRVPLFFYVLQWYVAHGMAVLLSLVAGRDYARLLNNPPGFMQYTPNTGFSLPVVYVLWIVGVALLYWPCQWFARVKAERRDLWWLRYC